MGGERRSAGPKRRPTSRWCCIGADTRMAVDRTSEAPLAGICYRTASTDGISFLKLVCRSKQGTTTTMTWIRTVMWDDADEKLRKAIEGEKLFYPKEYAEPVHPDPSGASSIVGSHTLIPEALYHAFATFGSLMSPDLPLQRRQHEMIATMVSVTNRCVY